MYDKSYSFVTSHPAISELKLSALENMPRAYTREETGTRSRHGHCQGYHVWGKAPTAPSHSPSHVERSELKFDAPVNMLSAVVTDETFHCDKSWLKTCA
jgi:hypothetical protein